MTSPDQFSNYLNLLKIRQSAKRWDVRIIGSISLLSFLSMLGFGLVSGLGSREIYLVGGVNVFLGIGFVTNWVRLEIITGTIELMNNLQIQDR
jgi:hypothetical protein